MRYFWGICFLFCFSLWSCDSLKKGGKTDSNSGCNQLQKVSAGDFNELSSDMYGLESVRQDGNHIVAEISSGMELSSSALYWNGSIMESYPPKANVKIVVKTQEGDGMNKVHQLCFDVKELKTPSNKIELYFLDDEETLTLDFME